MFKTENFNIEELEEWLEFEKPTEDDLFWVSPAKMEELNDKKIFIDKILEKIQEIKEEI